MKVCVVCEQRFTSERWQCPACGAVPASDLGYPILAPDLLEGNAPDTEYKYQEVFEIEAENFWFRSRIRLLIWALRQYFPDIESFLEIGCGTGFVLSEIRRAFPVLRLSASDILVRGLSYVEKRLPNVTLFQMDARRIPFDNEFDVIGAFDVVEHIQEDERVFAEMFRAIRPGGGIVMTVPQHPFLWSYSDDLSCHKRRYTRAEFVEKVEKAGFTVVATISFVSFLLPLLILSRVRHRKFRDKSDLIAGLQMGSFLNRLLEKIMDLERFFITRGFFFPAGGSLLMIAKKNWR